ncbi:MAG: hypothetical protein NTAFB09_27540 [Nitrosospira sp.]
MDYYRGKELGDLDGISPHPNPLPGGEREQNSMLAKTVSPLAPSPRRGEGARGRMGKKIQPTFLWVRAIGYKLSPPQWK